MLAEFKQARVRGRVLSGMKAERDTIETALGGLRALWRSPGDCEHIAGGLRLAGVSD